MRKPAVSDGPRITLGTEIVFGSERAGMDDKLDRIMESVQQVNVHLESLRVSVIALVQQQDDHEQRLRTLERWRNNLTPIFALLTFVVGSLFTAVLERFF